MIIDATLAYAIALMLMPLPQILCRRDSEMRCHDADYAMLTLI